MDNPKLKDLYFTQPFVDELGQLLSYSTPAFDVDQFKRCLVLQGLADADLKEKMAMVTRCLHAGLALPYPEALAQLRLAAPSFSGFNAMVFPDFVGPYGLDHWEISVQALREFTGLCSSEYGVRPFLTSAPDRMLAQMLAWAADPDEHVRRLASEGCRPRLPWAAGVPALKKDPAPILPVLECLRGDESEYVRRSVANNLNDISKDHPDVVLDAVERWYGEKAETDRLLKHACRSLLKSGSPRALRVFGFSDPEHVTISDLRIQPAAPRIGEAVEYSFDVNLDAVEAELLRLELHVSYARPGGKISRKVFQIREGSFAPGKHTLRRKFSFADVSVRKHHPGPHVFVVSVNGVPAQQLDFRLRA